MNSSINFPAEPHFEPSAPVYLEGELPLDMREVTPGSAIDEFHFSMWAGFIEFALKQEEIRAEFEAETGKSFAKPPATPLDAMIDKACGFDRTADQLSYIAEFARWVTPLYFGGPEDICPAIAAKLAQGIEAGTAETAQTGSVHESPVAGGDAPNSNGPSPEGFVR